LTYNLFRTYNNILLSKNLYVLELEGYKGCYVMRFRIGDVRNEFANFRYTLQFFNWYKDEFKDTHYTYKNEIPELDLVYNEDMCISISKGCRVKDVGIRTDKKTVRNNSDALAKVLFADDNVFYAHNSICITLEAVSTRTSEMILVRRYYGKRNIRFARKCADVYKWEINNKDNKSKIMWQNIDKYEEMNKEETDKLLSLFHLH